jgi:HSP20 family protein
MELTKLKPWNWFKHEEQPASSGVPVRRSSSNPDPVSQLHQEIDRVFDNAFFHLGLPSLGMDSPLAGISHDALLRPNVDIASSDKEYTITVEVPGVEEDNIKLELIHNTLTIQGKKNQESESKEKDFHRVERSYGSFRRVLSLPEDAVTDGIEANFKNGVLTICLPRKATSKESKKVVEIKKTI